MEHPLTQHAFEEALVRQCAPTFAGIKPANLFNYVGVFARTARNPEPAEALERRRDALLGIVRECNERLADAGVRVEVLVWRACGALVYACRPRALDAYLQDRHVARALRAHGYDPHDTGACIEMLGRKLAACSCGSELPHEVGLLLGYPVEDVMGFIEHGGRDYICFGCWKVYANPRRALKSFSQIRRCTRRLCALHAQGTPIGLLAAGPQRVATLRTAGNTAEAA